MLFDVSEPLTRSQYLGCLHAFVGQFQSEIYILKSLAVKLRGHKRDEVFGWAASLDQSRYRIPLMVDRWRYFIETAQERLIDTPKEMEHYAPVPPIVRALAVCAELEDMLSRINRFIDTLDEFTPDDVRMIGEMVEALDQELTQDRLDITRIASLLEDAGEITVTPDADTGLLMIGGMDDGPNYPEQFGSARELFSKHLRSGC